MPLNNIAKSTTVYVIWAQLMNPAMNLGASMSYPTHPPKWSTVDNLEQAQQMKLSVLFDWCKCCWLLSLTFCLVSAINAGGAELCYDIHCNISIAFHRSSRKRYLQYFYQQFWISHRNHNGKCGNATSTETTILKICHKHNLSFFPSIYCSTCRSSCKCYLQHIYQQLWFNSRNYHGEWAWPLKPSCKGGWYAM